MFPIVLRLGIDIGTSGLSIKLITFGTNPYMLTKYFIISSPASVIYEMAQQTSVSMSTESFSIKVFAIGRITGYNFI